MTRTTATNRNGTLLVKFRPVVIGFAWFISPEKSIAESGHWVATWGTAIETAQGNDFPSVPLAGKTLRQYVRTSIPASRIRGRFSNAYGASPVHIRGARVALAPSVGTGAINPETDRVLSFRGRPARS